MMVPPLRDDEFRTLADVIRCESGIHLTEVKKALVVARLTRRLHERRLESFAEYIHLVTRGGDRDERTRMIDCICTNETGFFRHPQHFELLRKIAFALPRHRAPRIWSAACSTGQEAYSLAMFFLTPMPPPLEMPQILATDLSTRALEKAERALYPIESASEIPQTYLKPFMLRGEGPCESMMKAGPEVRSVVRFLRWNLTVEACVPGAPFDVIFCRNVLMYFDAATRANVVRRLLEQLAPGGYLFVGAAESLETLSHLARSIAPSVYVHKARSEKTRKGEEA